MNIKFNNLIVYLILVFLSFTACQDEISEVENPDEQETIVPNSTLATLMSRTTANYGAADDILDGASCFSVELPVTIVVGDITIVIETEDDLEALEDVLDDVNVDALDFVFPITITFSDYSQIIIETADELQSFIDQCLEEEIDIIECADFVYPISFSVFNSGFNLVDTVVIEHDEALYAFLDELEDDENALIVSLNFPISLEYANGETIEVNTNEELADAIAVAEQFCADENDGCLEDEIALNLVECHWDFTNGTDTFNNYQMVFNANGDLLIPEGLAASAIGGNWSLSTTDSGVILTISELTAFQDTLEGNWLIVECDAIEFIITQGDVTLELEQDCEGDLGCSVADINANITECAWLVETNLIDSVIPIYAYFTTNGQVLLDDNNSTETQIGTWDLMMIASDIFIEFTLQQGFETLNGQWQIVECEDGQLNLINGSNYINLEQDCDFNTGNEVFDCFSDFEIVECEQPNNIPVYNLNAGTIGLVDCIEPFTASFHETLADAETNVNPIANTEAYGTLVAQVYLRIEAENGNFEVFTVYLNTIGCNYFECFENRVIEVCDDDINDGFVAFDLNLIYANCPEDNVVVTFHVANSDAEAANNALASPFVNTTNPQTLYARIELAGDASIYEVFEVLLRVEDCEESCSEEDVDTSLTQCIWNAVNYNGSDNLMIYNLDFESNSQIVVIYTDELTIDATWTTSQSNEGVIISFSNVAGPNIQAITGEWLVVECEENRLELYRGDDILVLERTCE